MAQARRWCFTWNNYTELDYGSIRESRTLERGNVRYLIVGRETAATGTRHLQGYVEFSKPTRLAACKRALGGESIHLEVARGTRDQCIEYCKKEDQSPFEYGSRASGGQGKRTDLASVVESVKSGASLRDICEGHGESFIKYSRGIEKLLGVLAMPRDFPTNFIWRWGITGTGKSRDTYAESQGLCNGRVAWLSDVSLKWFDPIKPDSRGIVLDEFDGTCSLAFLLRVLDRYPLNVPVKGGFVEFRARWVFITSQFRPAFYYGGDGQWPALCRRFRDFGQCIEYRRDGITETPKEDWEFICNNQ
nr:rep protein [Cressdnaviricota sp.]